MANKKSAMWCLAPRTAWRIAIGAAACLSLSCNDTTGSVACTDEIVTVSVSGGLEPVFTWSPACGMASIQVQPDTPNAGGWAIYSGQHSAENPLGSGIRYGHRPSLAVEPAPPRPLVSGVAYTVSVARWVADGHGSGALFIAGSATFRP